MEEVKDCGNCDNGIPHNVSSGVIACDIRDCDRKTRDKWIPFTVEGRRKAVIILACSGSISRWGFQMWLDDLIKMVQKDNGKFKCPDSYPFLTKDNPDWINKR